MVQRYEQMRRLQWYKRGAAYEEFKGRVPKHPIPLYPYHRRFGKQVQLQWHSKTI